MVEVGCEMRACCKGYGAAYVTSSHSEAMRFHPIVEGCHESCLKW